MRKRKINTGWFKKGSIPWNKGKRGYMGANRTSFTSDKINKKGEQAVGKPRLSKDYLVCLTNDRKYAKSNNGKGYFIRKRVSYPRWLLSQHGIDVGNNEVVYHIDGDLNNNELSNLEVISRAELIKRNRLNRSVK